MISVHFEFCSERLISNTRRKENGDWGKKEYADRGGEREYQDLKRLEQKIKGN